MPSPSWSASSPIRSTGRISTRQAAASSPATAILQPRVTASLTTGDDASFFQRVFSANRGLDPYVFAVSDVYQDVFGEGTFTGKGLYHVDAFEAALKGRIDENTMLSHDLLEARWRAPRSSPMSNWSRTIPTRYSVDASRHHRWARGDWQLLPLIFDPRSRRDGAVALEDGRQSAPLADPDLLGDGVDCRLDCCCRSAQPRSGRRC